MCLKTDFHAIFKENTFGTGKYFRKDILSIELGTIIPPIDWSLHAF